MSLVAALAAALLLDLGLGEYPNRLHPVVWMGWMIRLFERGAPRAPAPAFVYGLGMALLIPALFGLGAWWVSDLPWVGWVAAVFLLKSTMALRALGLAGVGVSGPLAADDLAAARLGLRSLCSRDPSALEAPALAAGAIESLAENLSDSWVAPLFWLLVGGVPGAVVYRAVNTLDASVGYRGRYEWLGKASARLDDALNLIPARLTALLLLVGAATLLREPAARGLRVGLRDRGVTESPNAGWPMATMAGILGVSLEKAGHYRLGAEGRPPEGADITRAWRVVRLAGALAAGLALAGLALRA